MGRCVVWTSQNKAQWPGLKVKKASLAPLRPRELAEWQQLKGNLRCCHKNRGEQMLRRHGGALSRHHSRNEKDLLCLLSHAVLISTIEFSRWPFFHSSAPVMCFGGAAVTPLIFTLVARHLL